jgi:hypothetical protein
MKKLTPKELQRARDALLATIAAFGAQPFRRSDVSRRIAGNRRLAPQARVHADDAAGAAMKEAADAGRIVRTGHLHWMRTSASRKLLDGTQIAELPAPIEVKLSTKVPEKWLLVDRETGEVWQAGHDGKLKRAPESTCTAIGKAIR